MGGGAGAAGGPRGQRLETSSLGTDRVARRDLFALELASFEAVPERLSLPSPHFACLVAADAELAPADALSAFCEALLRAGAVYACSWGPGCRRLHEHFGAARARVAPGAPWERSVMTSCRDGDSLDDALWYLIHLASPAEAFLPSCRAALAICVGAPRWSHRIRAVLADPPRLDERVAAAREAPRPRLTGTRSSSPGSDPSGLRG